jgi:hypothetical protein
MLKSKFIKIAVSSFLVLMALWVATPKVYIHQLLHHDHTDVSISTETKVKSQSSDDDCDFEKYNKPAYFNLFKFICSFIPSKSKSSTKIVEKALHLSGISYAISLLRGPPVSE